MVKKKKVKKPVKPTPSKSTGLKNKTAKKKKSGYNKVKNRLPVKSPADLLAERYAKFIVVLATCGNVRRAALEADICYPNVYVERKRNPAFAEAFEEALDIAADQLEGEAFRRAMDGWKEEVYQFGSLAGYMQKYSDTLLIFLLKGRRRKIYGDNFKLSNDPNAPFGGGLGDGGREGAIKEIFDFITGSETSGSTGAGESGATGVAKVETVAGATKPSPSK